MSEKVTLEGLAELVKNLREFADELKGNPLRAASRAMADVVRTAAIENAPVGETGRLQNAISQRLISARDRDAATSSGDSAEIFDVYVKMGKSRDDPRGAFYWWFVENGTVKQAAQPFLRPAFYENEAQLPDTFADKLRPVIERAAARRAYNP